MKLKQKMVKVKNFSHIHGQIFLSHILFKRYHHQIHEWKIVWMENSWWGGRVGGGVLLSRVFVWSGWRKWVAIKKKIL